MSLASDVLSVLLALVCAASSYADFKMMPQIVESMTKLKMPIRIIPAFGIAKIAGAAGLMVGFNNHNLRIYAAFCLTVFLFWPRGAMCVFVTPRRTPCRLWCCV